MTAPDAACIIEAHQILLRANMRARVLAEKRVDTLLMALQNAAIELARYAADDERTTNVLSLVHDAIAKTRS